MANHPVCLWLDDLQWCDSSTLDLLEYLLKKKNGASSLLDDSSSRLLILGCYREKDVLATDHPLMDHTNNLHSSMFWTIHVGCLSRDNANLLISNLLRLDPDQTEDLSVVIHRKVRNIWMP